MPSQPKDSKIFYFHKKHDQVITKRIMSNSTPALFQLKYETACTQTPKILKMEGTTMHAFVHQFRFSTINVATIESLFACKSSTDGENVENGNLVQFVDEKNP